jgi:hypothetical protein
MRPRKDVSEVEEISMQKVGRREDSEKQTYYEYDPCTSRERYYGLEYELVRRLGLGLRTINVLKSTQI